MTMKNKTTLIEAWGEELAQYPWDLFMTLTVKGRIGKRRAKERVWALLKAIRKAEGHRIEFIGVEDRHKWRSVPHYHFLVLNVKRVRRMRWVDWWYRKGYGTARIYKYDKKRGARFYMAKHLLDPDSDILISRCLKKFRFRT